MEDRSLDLISRLPKDILHLIVSILPLKEAVRTSVLSSLWRSLWRPHHVSLEQIITSHKANEGVVQVIGTFLRSYNNPELCKLCLGYLKMKEKLTILATKRVNKELHLDFSEDQQVTSDFNLKLEVTFRDFSSFSFLKTLHLRSVTRLAENIVPALFSNCWFLECLKLEKCIGLRCLDVKAGGCLESLTVVDCPNVADITLSAPTLKSFSYQGILPQIQLKNVSNLVDVMLDMRDGIGQNEFDCEELLSLLASLKDIEILTLTGWLLEWLCSAGVIFRHLDFRFSKLKELWWIESSINGPKCDSIAYFLDICPLLERLFINIDGGRISVTCPHFYHYWHEPYCSMHNAILKSVSLPLEHLKVVKMVGFKNQEDELLLMDFLLKKALILQLMTVTFGENHSWQVVKIPLSQLKLTTRSKSKHIAILSPKKDCFFGFIEEDSNGLCPLHAQQN